MTKTPMYFLLPDDYAKEFRSLAEENGLGYAKYFMKLIDQEKKEKSMFAKV